ncbi:MAG TPA: DUF2786 domain-containing protein [Polyangiaceae bacterium]|nr:DUF2786 domain-containing protein [Polyangiaceae bacterium]
MAEPRARRKPCLEWRAWAELGLRERRARGSMGRTAAIRLQFAFQAAVHDKTSDVEGLTIELERAALRAVRTAYAELNESLFGRRLRYCQLTFVDPGPRLGRWVGDLRSIELSRALLIHHGWGVLIEVLKHEMAHQYVYEVEGSPAEPPHGPAFRRVCRERGIDERATGIPLGAEADSVHARILERVSKLLALAESANEHEAQNAMSAAQRLMLKYNIEVTFESRATSYGFRHLGRASGRVSEAERRLANILADHFFVECIWVPVWRPLEGKRGSILEVCGRGENLELAEYVYSFLRHTAEALFREYKKQNGVHRNTSRQSYTAGVMLGFQDKLREERKKSQHEGLVWLGDAELRSWFERRYPRVRRVSRAGARRSQAYAHGREAGKRIVLHRGVSQGASSGVRLLAGRGTRSS